MVWLSRNQLFEKFYLSFECWHIILYYICCKAALGRCVMNIIVSNIIFFSKCHTATAIAVIDYVCTTNLRCLVITFMVYSRSQCVMTLRPSERSELFSADLTFFVLFLAYNLKGANLMSRFYTREPRFNPYYKFLLINTLLTRNICFCFFRRMEV